MGVDILEPSLQKQRLFAKYAQDEISWSELSNAVRKIQPPAVKRRFVQILAMLVSACLVSLLIPPWVRRNDS